MARPLRLECEGAWYHVMNRGVGHCTIFHDDVQRGLKRFGVETHAWCLMDNHCHLHLHTPHANLSGATATSMAYTSDTSTVRCRPTARRSARESNRF